MEQEQGRITAFVQHILKLLSGSSREDQNMFQRIENRNFQLIVYISTRDMDD